MSFSSPLWLLSLLVVAAAAAAYVWAQRRPVRYAVAYSNLDVLAAVVEQRQAWRRHLPAAVLLAALAALCLGLARPAVTMSVPDERATVVLVVDVSGSMRAEDVKPTRLAAAQTAVERFLDRVPAELRVGIVSFSDGPEVIAPPTTDRKLLRETVRYLAPGLGTAIGDALARGVELAQQALAVEARQPVAREGEDPLAAIVLLSDGFQTRGLLTPAQGALRAAQANVPVYTIALGTDGGEITVARSGILQTVPVPPDRATLAQIAEDTGGEYHDAQDADAALRAYEQLGSKIGRRDEQREATVAFLGAGAALLLGAAGLAALRAPLLP